MKITSSLFRNGEHIPQMFNCPGPNINPPIQFVTGNKFTFTSECGAIKKSYVNRIIFGPVF